MEHGGGPCRDLNQLISELTQGKELTRQLETHMERSSSPTEQCKHLVQSLLSTWDKAIFMAQSSGEWDCERRGGAGWPPSAGGSDSPCSLTGSPRSEGSDRAPRDHPLESREMIKKRKTLPKLTRRVRVGSETTGLEGPLADGFGWRKYGQKDILGAKHPRGYYRCTHRNSQGCPALKLVQRSDDDPSVFDVTYRGHHTCIQGVNPAAETSTAAEAAAEQQQQEVGNAPGERLLLDFRSALTVRTEGLDDGGPFPFPLPSPSFSFPSAAVGWASSPAAALDSPFAGSFSPPFISPRAASEPTSFPAPPAQVGASGGRQSPPAPESDLADVFCGTASNADDLWSAMDRVESDPNFPFDSRFFPGEFH